MAVNDRPKILFRSQNRVLESTITADGADTETTALSVGTTSTYNRAAGSFVDDGFLIDDSVTGSGFTNSANNATSTVTAVTATVLTITGNTLVVEAAGVNERIVKVITPDTPLTEMQDPRRLVYTKFPAKVVNINFDLGPRSPWNITAVGIILQKSSVATNIRFMSKAATADSYTTQQAITLWTPETSDGADGYSADARPADEYPSDDTREFPNDPLYYCLLASAKNHRYWRIRVTDTGGDGNVYASVPFIGIPWEAPTDKGISSFSLVPIDDSTVTETPTGVDTINPGRRRKEINISFQQTDSSDTWSTVIYRLEEHGITDPAFVFLIPPASDSNVITATDADGRVLYRSSLYGRLASLPDFSYAPNAGLSYVDIGGFSVRETF